MSKQFADQSGNPHSLSRLAQSRVQVILRGICMLLLLSAIPDAASAEATDETIEYFYWDIPNDNDLFGLATGFVYTDKRRVRHYVYGFSDKAHHWPLDFFERKDPKFRLGKLVMRVRPEPPAPVLGTKLLKSGTDLAADFEKLKSTGTAIEARQSNFTYVPNPKNALPIDLDAYKVIERDGVRVIVPKTPTERIDLVLWDIPDDEDKFGKTSAIRYTDKSGKRTYIYGVSSLGDNWPDGFLNTGEPDYVHGILIAKITDQPPAPYFSHMGVVATGADLSRRFKAMVAVAERIETLKPVFAYLPAGKQANGNALSNGVMVTTGYSWPEIKSLFYQ